MFSADLIGTDRSSRGAHRAPKKTGEDRCPRPRVRRRLTLPGLDARAVEGVQNVVVVDHSLAELRRYRHEGLAAAGGPGELAFLVAHKLRVARLACLLRTR